MTTRVDDLLRGVTQQLAAVGIETPARDARELVAIALGVPSDRVRLMGGDPVSHDALQILDDILPDRLARKPMSHITRARAFWRHDFFVTEDVLDPRPETEILVQEALKGPIARVLDLGTGSGAILVSILAERPAVTGVGTDMSEEALKVAAHNGQRMGVADRLQWLRSDWFSEVAGQYDLIVSNPPYIATEEMPGLAPELGYEPRMALTDDGDGLSAYRAIASGAARYLSPGGRLCVEIGPTQADAVSCYFTEAGLGDLRVIPDLDGRDRVVSARRA